MQLTLHTFKVKENIWLVVFKHLGHKFHIHILNVNFLLNATIRDCSTDNYISIWNDTCRLLFSTIIASLSFSYWNLSVIPVRDREQAWGRTILVMIRESSWICWCSWGLSWRFCVSLLSQNWIYTVKTRSDSSPFWRKATQSVIMDAARCLFRAKIEMLIFDSLHVMCNSNTEMVMLCHAECYSNFNRQ